MIQVQGVGHGSPRAGPRRMVDERGNIDDATIQGEADGYDYILIRERIKVKYFAIVHSPRYCPSIVASSLRIII